MSDSRREIRWVGSSLEDLRRFPEEVRREVGLALFQAQRGEKPASAKPMEGFKGAKVLKIVEDHDGNTYRVVYTVKFPEVVYVLHCFQKKSKSGIATPKRDVELIRARFRSVQQIESEQKKWQK
ncbi:MAG: addiction module toxin RelE [Armatimonadetes bacterium]|nr:addiction module toxin RelE [Armatimonadota bacterium]NOG93744.1 addiction module toxin RelE [Armatimonadota bacterium]